MKWFNPQVDGATPHCDCPSGFHGQNCEIKAVNSCRNNLCANGATCIGISDSQYRCQCVMGFTGTHCSSEQHECLSQPCQNGQFSLILLERAYQFQLDFIYLLSQSWLTLHQSVCYLIQSVLCKVVCTHYKCEVWKCSASQILPHGPIKLS